MQLRMVRDSALIQQSVNNHKNKRRRLKLFRHAVLHKLASILNWSGC